MPSRRRGCSDEDWHSLPVLYQPVHISMLGDIGVRSTVRTAQADIGHDPKTHGAHAFAWAPNQQNLHFSGAGPSMGLFQEHSRRALMQREGPIYCLSHSVEGCWSHMGYSSLSHLSTLRPNSVALSTVNICIIRHWLSTYYVPALADWAEDLSYIMTFHLQKQP